MEMKELNFQKYVSSILRTSFLNGRKVLEKKHYNFKEFDKIIDLLKNKKPLPNKQPRRRASGYYKLDYINSLPKSKSN